MADTLTLGPVTLALPLSVAPRSRYEGFIEDADGMRVCCVDYAMGATAAENDRIAHLFAAAPDLLLAAEDVLFMLANMATILDAEDDRKCNALRLAIARARGATP